MPLRTAAYRAFARATGADLDEAELDLRSYRSLGDLFARRLRPGARPVCPDHDAIVAPCDGVLSALGTAGAGAMVEAKGVEYPIDELLGDPALAARLVGGPCATIYLAPGDYHRVHAPVDARLVRYDYVPGTPWTVNPPVAARRDRGFVRNERVVITLDAGHYGAIAVVMVGAAGGGNIELEHAPDAATWRTAGERRRVEVGVDVQRGDEIGAFRLGSTVVMVFRPGKFMLDGVVGQALRCGERVGSIRGLGRR